MASVRLIAKGRGILALMQRWHAVLAISLIAGASVLLAACRLMGSGSGPVGSPNSSASRPSAAATVTGDASPSAFAGGEAPEECGFPPGTALAFAGRSTTATLNVQEVVGDPMSDDPADIYITAEPIDPTGEPLAPGEVPVRLVCAIYVNEADGGFVEITVHPEDGGRYTTPTPFPSTSPPAVGIAETDAIEAALAWLPPDLGYYVASTEAGPIGRVQPVWEVGQWARPLTADDWVWKVFAKRTDYGVEIYIDYVDGSVLGYLENVVD